MYVRCGRKEEGLILYRLSVVAPDTHLTRDEIVRRIVAQLPVERVILFGSQAAGTADKDSDVDLLIVAPFTSRRLDVSLQIRKALRGLGIAKDVLVLRPEEFETQKDVPGTVAWPAAHGGRVLFAG